MIRALAAVFAFASSLFASTASAQGGAYRDPLAGKEFEVVKVDKKAGIVIIDGGSTAGVTRGRSICIVNRSDEQVGCWPVSGIKPAQAALTVPKAQLKRIKRGMIARPAQQLQPQAGAYPAYGARGAPTGQMPVSSRTGLAFVTLGYAYVPLLPFNYEVPAFDLAARGTSDPLWKKGTAVKSSPAEVRFIVETPLTASVALTLGIVYRHINETKTQTDYDAADASAFVDEQVTAQSIGVPLQARWLFGSGQYLFLLAEGLEIDYSSVRVRASTRNDNSDAVQRIADLVSNLTVYSIRGDFAGVIRFTPGFSGQIGLALLIPVASGGSAKVAKLTLPADADPTRDHEKDFIDALGHRRSKVGVEIPISLSVTF